MESVYERAYQQMLQEGVEDDDAIEFVNILYDEEALHDLDENAAFRLVSGISRATGLNRMSTVNSLRFLKGMIGPGFSKALQRRMSGVILKSPPKPPSLPEPIKGTPVQTSIFTKTGKTQNFTGGRTPYTGTSIPTFQGPKPAAPAVQTPRSTQAPGQMQIPGTSNRAQELRNVTRNPNTGLPGASNTGLTAGDSSLGGYGARTLNSQPLRRTPDVPKSAPATPTPKAKVNPTVPALTGAVTATALGGDNKQRTGLTQAQKDSKLAQQRAETQKASQPVPEPTGERSAATNVAKQERAKVSARKLSAAARDFDRTFADARSQGLKVFTWRGKQYNTKLK